MPDNKKKTPPKKKTPDTFTGVLKNIWETAKFVDSKEGRALGAKRNAEKVKRYKDTEGDSLDENILEFVDPTGITSWDDVGRSIKKNGLLSGETFIEGMGALPAVGYLGRTLKVGKMLSKTNKAAGAGAIATGLGIKLTDTVRDAISTKESVQEGNKTKSKYLTGSRVNYMDNPSTVLMENWKDRAEAELAGQNNFVGQALDVIGPIAAQALQSYGMKGYQNSLGKSPVQTSAKPLDMKGFDFSQITDSGFEIPRLDKKYATGGAVPQREIEVEGQEVYELPSGEVGQFSGPSHEEGGIDVAVPIGTDIYSKRIKGSDGKTMAQRKKEREALTNKLEKKISTNPGDVLSKSSAERMFLGIDLQEEQDMEIMQKEFDKTNQQEFATGGPVSGRPIWNSSGIDYAGLWNQMNDAGMFIDETPIDLGATVVSAPKAATSNKPPAMPVEPTQKKGSNLLGMTAGDLLGTTGNILKANQAYKDTLGEVSGSIPNVNSYENFGQNSLQTLQGNQATLQQLYDNQTKSLRSRTQASVSQNRATARGVNTMRAGDLASFQSENQAQQEIDATNTQAILANNAAIAQQESVIDKAVMTGDAQKRLADQMDYAQDNMNLQQGRQSIIDSLTTQNADVLNKVHGRKLMANLLSARYDNFEVDAFGNVTSKPGIANLTTDQQINKAGLWDTYQDAKRQGTGVEFKNGNLYLTGTNTIYAPGEGGQYNHENRNYRDILDVGSDYQAELGDNYVATPEYTLPKELHSGVTAGNKDLTSNMERYLLDNNLQSIDLSTPEAVKAFQTELGIKKPDGKFGKNTLKALQDYKNKSKDALPKIAGVSSKEFSELEETLNSAGTMYSDYKDYIGDNLGDVDEDTFNKDNSLRNEVTMRSILGAVKYADLNYAAEKETLSGLTKAEYRKALLLYPDLSSRDTTTELDLDIRVPGTTKTLGYLLQGNKYKGKRYIKR